MNGTRLTFVYDGLSRRIEKRVKTHAPGSSTWTMVDRVGFVYDGWNVVMSVRLNASDTVLGRIASYVWGPDVGSSWFARADWKRAGGVGGLLMILDGVSTPRSDGSNSPADPSDDDYFPLMDRLGNVTGYRKAANNTAYNDLSLHGAVYEYDAFGRELRSSGPVADWAPFHFSTKFTDAETGLNYYGYRYYDAAKGRWLSRDPIGERGGSNLSGFLRNSPLSAVDVLGNISFGEVTLNGWGWQVLRGGLWAVAAGLAVKDIDLYWTADMCYCEILKYEIDWVTDLIWSFRALETAFKAERELEELGLTQTGGVMHWNPSVMNIETAGILNSGGRVTPAEVRQIRERELCGSCDDDELKKNLKSQRDGFESLFNLAATKGWMGEMGHKAIFGGNIDRQATPVGHGTRDYWQTMAKRMQDYLDDLIADYGEECYDKQ